jgi:phage-related protein
MQAKYYRLPDGSEPVNDFIRGLLPIHQVAIDTKIEMLDQLREKDPPLEYPITSQLKGQLRELRVRSWKTRYRILYCRSGGFFILLHILEKNSEKVPLADIEIAQKRWEDFQARMNAVPRVPPRAMGHDAP